MGATQTSTHVASPMDGDAVLKRVAEPLAHGIGSVEDRIMLSFAYPMALDRRSTSEVSGRIMELIKHLPDPEQASVTAIFLGISGRQRSAEQPAELRTRHNHGRLNGTRAQGLSKARRSCHQPTAKGHIRRTDGLIGGRGEADFAPAITGYGGRGTWDDGS